MANLCFDSTPWGPARTAMQPLPTQLAAGFDRRLDQARVPQILRPDYHIVHWVRTKLFHSADSLSGASPPIRGGFKFQSESARSSVVEKTLFYPVLSSATPPV